MSRCCCPSRYRVVIPPAGRIFVEYRHLFPWPRWRREKRWVCTGWDIEPRPLSFDSVDDALRWIATAEAQTA